MQFVLILVAAAEKIDEKLAAAVAATLPECNGAAVDVVWRYGLAVRVQWHLSTHNHLRPSCSDASSTARPPTPQVASPSTVDAAPAAIHHLAFAINVAKAR